MEYEIVQRVYENHVDEELFDLPPYVFIEHREGVWVAVNYTHQPFKFPIKEEMTILFGQPEIEPGQILVWKTKR